MLGFPRRVTVIDRLHQSLVITSFSFPTSLMHYEGTVEASKEFYTALPKAKKRSINGC